ncbi:MAG TPA: hypothetical protein VGJ84_02590 [Polyangiaceae bacterium]|jgi:hypothetical protein
MRFVVATHGHCFDGLASATLFTRLMRDVSPNQTRLEYRGCGYGFGQPRADEALLNGEDNAILDYRFNGCKRLGWFFDHHRTAFQNQEDRAEFERRRDNGRFFYEPEYSSCTQLIADVGREHFNVHDPSLEELVRWADIIDAARFDSPDQAISRESPILRMVSVVEHYADDALITHLVQELLQKPLSEVARSDIMAERYRPLGVKHARFVEHVRSKSELRGRVVFVDLTDAVLESVGKFVTYALFPQSVYSVMVGLLKNGPKISVGYNPWSGRPRDVDISAICARYGGGGHPVVGGISFRNNELDQARQVARSIADELG